MSGRFDALLGDAAQRTPAWDEHRAARVLARTLRAHDERLGRSRTMRRALALGAGAAAVVLFLVRGLPAPPVDAPAAVAQLGDGDGGYGRD